MLVVADGDIGREPSRPRVQVESNCSCSHGPVCRAGVLQRRVGRRLVRGLTWMWKGHGSAHRTDSSCGESAPTTPLMVLVRFFLPWLMKNWQDAHASSSLGVLLESSTSPSFRRVNRDQGSRRESEM
jgi:hypothetical protein